jgi:hypothetical protein
MLEDLGAPGGADALGRGEVLDRDRDAVERADGGLLPERRGGALRGGQGLLPRDRDVGVDARVHRVDAREHGPHDLEGRDLAGAIEALERGGRGKAQVMVGHGGVSSAEG